MTENEAQFVTRPEPFAIFDDRRALLRLYAVVAIVTLGIALLLEFGVNVDPANVLIAVLPVSVLLLIAIPTVRAHWVHNQTLKDAALKEFSRGADSLVRNSDWAYDQTHEDAALKFEHSAESLMRELDVAYDEKLAEEAARLVKLFRDSVRPLERESDSAADEFAFLMFKLLTRNATQSTVLEQYRIEFPNTERVFVLLERWAIHRQALATKKAQAEISQAFRHQLLVFVIMLTALAGSFVLLWEGHDVAGLLTFISTVVSTAGLFVAGRTAQTRAERKRIEELVERLTAAPLHNTASKDENKP